MSACQFTSAQGKPSLIISIIPGNGSGMASLSVYHWHRCHRLRKIRFFRRNIVGLRIMARSPFLFDETKTLHIQITFSIFCQLYDTFLRKNWKGLIWSKIWYLRGVVKTPTARITSLKSQQHARNAEGISQWQGKDQFDIIRDEFRNLQQTMSVNFLRTLKSQKLKQIRWAQAKWWSA